MSVQTCLKLWSRAADCLTSTCHACWQYALLPDILSWIFLFKANLNPSLACDVILISSGIPSTGRFTNFEISAGPTCFNILLWARHLLPWELERGIRLFQMYQGGAPILESNEVENQEESWREATTLQVTFATASYAALKCLFIPQASAHTPNQVKFLDGDPAFCHLPSDVVHKHSPLVTVLCTPFLVYLWCLNAVVHLYITRSARPGELVKAPNLPILSKGQQSLFMVGSQRIPKQSMWLVELSLSCWHELSMCWSQLCKLEDMTRWQNQMTRSMW